MEIRDLLVTAHVQGADDDRLVLHAQGDLLVGGKLLVLGGEILGVHEEELGAEEADALAVMLGGDVGVVGVADVGDE